MMCSANALSPVHPFGLGYRRRKSNPTAVLAGKALIKMILKNKMLMPQDLSAF